MKQPINVILASQSENRRQLLSSLGIAFSAVPSHIDEEAIDHHDLGKKVQAIAQAKARQVVAEHRGLIIAADTFSVYNGKQYHKPKDLGEAKEMLREISGHIGHVLSGVCVINTQEPREVLALSTLDIQCRKLSEPEIEDYVTRCPVTEWAAAYNPLDPISLTIFKVLGHHPYRIEYYGIGIETVVAELRRAGVAVDLSQARA